MRYPLLGFTIAVTAMLGAWGLDALEPDAMDAVRIGFAIAVLSCWLPLAIATWYAFRNADLRRMLHACPEAPARKESRMTPKQKELLDFIIAYQRGNTGVSPSFRIMADALEMQLSRIHTLMQALKTHGYIHYEPTKKRQIHVMYSSEETPSPDFRYRGRSTIKLAEYLAGRFGIEEAEIRQALLEMPA